MKIIAFVLLELLSMASSKVLPLSPIVSRQSDNDNPTADQICDLTYADARATWEFGGAQSASSFLDKWIHDNGDLNWVNNMDRQTTLGGSATSPLDCVNLDGNSCPAGDINQCKFFTPPALYHVRAAVTNLFDMVKIFKNEMDFKSILALLQISQINDDFAPSELSTPNIYGILNGAFTIAAGVSGASVPFVALFTAIAGIFGIVASVPPPDSEPSHPITDMEQILKRFTGQIHNETDNFIKKAMAGPTDGLDSWTLPHAGDSPNGERQAIARFFAEGRFLFDRNVNQNSGGSNSHVPNLKDDIVLPYITRASTLLNQGLVFEALQSNKYYILVDPSRDSNACDPTVSAWIYERCFTIQKDGKAIEKEMLDKMSRPDRYNISMGDMYRNAWDCYYTRGYEGKFEFNVTMTQEDLKTVTASLFPQCFVPLAVIEAKSTPCNLVSSYDMTCAKGFVKYDPTRFDSLGFTKEKCECDFMLRC